MTATRDPSAGAMGAADKIAPPHLIVVDCWYSCPLAVHPEWKAGEDEDYRWASCRDLKDGEERKCDCGREALVVRIALALDEFTEAERAACEAAVNGKRMTGPSCVGPLLYAGWQEAIEHAAAAIAARRSK